MSGLLSVAGATLLASATIPQVVKLLRDRRADDFHLAFVLLHLVGLSLLAVRSAQLREWPFFGVNTIGALFWLLVLAIKARTSRGAGAPADASTTRA